MLPETVTTTTSLFAGNLAHNHRQLTAAAAVLYISRRICLIFLGLQASETQSTWDCRNLVDPLSTASGTKSLLGTTVVSAV